MRNLAFFFLFISSAHAVEVVTLDFAKSSLEIVVVSTDENFNAMMDKHFVARACKLRYSNNISLSVRETYFPKVCRAEVIQFLMNNGYKADAYFSTFTK